MTLDQLRYFLEASKFEHVGKAARSIHISPGAVSTAISSLEKELQCQFFRRHKNRIYLNARGKYLREQAAATFKQLDRVRLELQGEGFKVEGSYRIAASHFLASRFMASAWTELSRDQPKVSVELCSMATVTVVNEVLRGALDFGLCFSPLTHPDLHASLLHSGTLLIAVGRRHPFARPRPAFSLADLSRFPAAIHKSAPGVDVCATHPNFERYGIEPSVMLQFDSDDLAVEALKGGRSWSLLPDLVVRSSPELVVVPHPGDWRAPYVIALICRKTRQEDALFPLLKAELERKVKLWAPVPRRAAARPRIDK